MALMLKPLADKGDENEPNLQRSDSMLNSLADAVIAVDNEMRIKNFNAAALNLLDLNVINPDAQLRDVFKPFDKMNQQIDIEVLVKSIHLPTVNTDYRLKYSDGSMINLYTSIAPVKLNYGKQESIGFVLLLRDITREKALEEERDEFISVVSHELRAPIAISEGNIGNAEYIVEKKGDLSAVKQALNQAHNQVLFLADLINDLSTLSRAERGVLHVEIDSINLTELINELAKTYEPQAEKKGLQIRIDLDPSLEIIHSSVLYIREILQNFVTNALKYTDHGYIQLSAKNDQKGVLISISDSGIGISKADQTRVFDKFFRSEDSRTRKENGTGLGLYVTQKLAKLIRAELSMNSELDKGSTFSVLVPDLKPPA